MKYDFIDEAKKEFPVSRLCRQLAVSESGYYGRRTRSISRRQREDVALSAHVRASFVENRSVYGSIRLTQELQEKGLSIGRRRVARLMRENNLSALRKRRHVRTTDSNHTLPVAPNLLKQDFSVNAPDQKWGADISCV